MRDKKSSSRNSLTCFADVNIDVYTLRYAIGMTRWGRAGQVAERLAGKRGLFQMKAETWQAFHHCHQLAPQRLPGYTTVCYLYRFGESWSYLTHRSTSSTDAVISFLASSPTHTLTIEKSPFRSIDMLPPCVPSLLKIGSALQTC
jgi:hypothetical protein